MTPDEKYEIATLASEVERTRGVWEMHCMLNTPSDPVEREKTMIAYAIAHTEFLQACAALRRVQLRISGG